MVYDKARSGDPDYDDKQPPEFHAGGAVVSAGDGIVITPATGPVDMSGAHVNLAVDENDLDNRPTPGNVADKPSEVQQYAPEDTPTFREPDKADQADLDVIANAQGSVRVAEVSQRGRAENVADESHTRSADITAAKGENASASTPVKKSGTSSK